MSGIFPNAAEVALLERVLLPTLTCRLYSNNLVPGPTNVLGDFVQASFPAYVDQVIQPGMTTPVVNPLNQAHSESAILSWVRGAGVGTQTIYGYVIFLTDISGTVIFGAEAFSTPRTLTNPGDSLTLQVSVILSSAP